ncbi:hypothetical protein [Kitasatospora sp. McL0602]|uniref:hypothetical protein n=1 Tax=Kitasatospora sp. McL0602 TaxID=3439530 RepID=UPI003F88A5D3
MTTQSTVRQEQLEEFAQAVELQNVATQECSASRHSDENPSRVNISLESGVLPLPDGINYRFSIKCDLASDSNDSVANLTASVIAKFSLQPGVDPDPTVLSAFGNTIGIMASYPYLRQIIHDMAARVGLQGLTLGLLKQGSETPIAVSMALPTPPSASN